MSNSPACLLSFQEIFSCVTWGWGGRESCHTDRPSPPPSSLGGSGPTFSASPLCFYQRPTLDVNNRINNSSEVRSKLLVGVIIQREAGTTSGHAQGIIPPLLLVLVPAERQLPPPMSYNYQHYYDAVSMM